MPGGHFCSFQELFPFNHWTESIHSLCKFCLGGYHVLSSILGAGLKLWAAYSSGKLHWEGSPCSLPLFSALWDVLWRQTWEIRHGQALTPNSSAYQLHIATVTNGHKLHSENKYILLWVWRSEVQYRFCWVQAKVWAGLVTSRSPEKRIVAFSASSGHLYSLACGPFLSFKAHHSTSSSVIASPF